MLTVHAPFVPRTKADLELITTPAFVPGGELESYRRTYYDVATIADGATQAPYYTVPRANSGDTNLENPGSGQLSRNTWFSIGSVHFTPLVQTEAAAVPAIWADVQALVLSANARATLIVENKRYGSWPLREMGAIGGVQGFGFNSAAVATTASEYGANGPLRAGAYVGGTIWLTPNASFGWLVEWDAPGVDLAAESIRCSLEMVGSVYRPVK